MANTASALRCSLPAAGLRPSRATGGEGREQSVGGLGTASHAGLGSKFLFAEIHSSLTY